MSEDYAELPRAYEIQSRLLDGSAQILILTIYDRHPDKGGRQIDGGYYPSIGLAARECGFKRYWESGEPHSVIFTEPEFVFSPDRLYWCGSEYARVRRFPPEFYQHRPPDADIMRFFPRPTSLPPCDNRDCPVGCPDDHCVSFEGV